MKCDSCIHKQVCKDKPPESYPRVMIDTITENCEYYTNVADVQPVVHAEWICHEPEIGLYYSCSKCGHNALQGMYKFCPNCGAKMDGDRDD